MNFILICLHSLDMRDFHSHLRQTPFLDSIREQTVFIPMGRAQAHHQCDSLVADMTGVWSARMGDSKLTKNGYQAAKRFCLAKTMIEYFQENGYDIITKIGLGTDAEFGTFAVKGGMTEAWLRNEPDRLAQFNYPGYMGLDEWINRIRNSKKFCAHIFIRETHRPWGQNEGLCALVGKGPAQYPYWPEDARCARQAALEHPDEFAALRRRGLRKADQIIQKIFEATREIENVTYVIYSNHGEAFDHFRYHYAYPLDRHNMIYGTSHGNFPYEVVYANTQMWMIPGLTARTMIGIGRSIDIVPTILALAQIKPETMDGESMLPYFSNGAFPNRDRYAESYSGSGCISMVNDGRFKLISTGQLSDISANDEVKGPALHKLAVFDLLSDPYEYVNIVNTPAGQDVLGWAIEKHASLTKLLSP